MRKKEENLFRKEESAKIWEKKRSAVFSRVSVGTLTKMLCCVAIVVFAFVFALPQAGFSKDKLVQSEAYKSIVSLWHIDSFEGGVGSRAEFLLRRAAEYEKKHPGVFVMVTSLTAESATEKFAAGETPDIVSYGYGVEILNYSSVDTEKTCAYGTLDGTVYAVPWCMGGYVVLSREELPEDKVLPSAVVSKGNFTQPYAALAASGYTLQNAVEKSPLEAYYRFVSGMSDILIGTQRDINRLNLREESAVITPLEGYNDLYQYFSVAAASSEKKYYAEEFIGYVLSDGAQEKLSSIGMLSPYIDLSYETEGLTALQSVKNAKGISVFMPVALYSEFSENALLAAGGDAAALKKMKNMLV